MHNARPENMFNFGYRKSSAEINEKLVLKVTQLRKKIVERIERVKRLKEEHKITNEIYINLLEQARDAQKKGDNKMSYSISNAQLPSRGGIKEEDFTIGAGVVMNLLTENDSIRNEEAQVTRFELIVRNLRDLPDEDGKAQGHRLSEEELVYLGF